MSYVKTSPRITASDAGRDIEQRGDLARASVGRTEHFCLHGENLSIAAAPTILLTRGKAILLAHLIHQISYWLAGRRGAECGEGLSRRRSTEPKANGDGPNVLIA